jgi:hypothetical protein
MVKVNVVVQLLFAQRFIIIFNCRYHTSNHLSVCHKPTSLSPINCQSVNNCSPWPNLPVKVSNRSITFSRFWGSLPSTFKIFRPWKKSSTKKSWPTFCDQYFWKFPIWNSRADEKRWMSYLMISDTPYGHAPTYQISLTYLETKILWPGQENTI